MHIDELLLIFKQETKYKPASIHHVLDFFQSKYITGKINVKRYRDIYHCLHEQGAISAHELAGTATTV